MVSELSWIPSHSGVQESLVGVGRPPPTHTHVLELGPETLLEEACTQAQKSGLLGLSVALSPSPIPPGPLPSASLSLNPECTASYQPFCLLHSQAPPDDLHSLSSFLTSLSQPIQSRCQPFSPLRTILARCTTMSQIAEPAECLSVLIWPDFSVIFSVIDHPLLVGPAFYDITLFSLF